MPRQYGSTPKTRRFRITRTCGPNTGQTEKPSLTKHANSCRSKPTSQLLNFLMPQVPITMPQLGESMAEATIVSIKVKPGDKVAADQEIIEVETAKALMS